VDESVKAQVSNAAGMGPITSAWEKGLKVYIHGWVYHLESGQLRDLNVTVSPPA
jgi:carbonic anhydrase